MAQWSTCSISVAVAEQAIQEHAKSHLLAGQKKVELDCNQSICKQLLFFNCILPHPPQLS